MLFYEKYKRLRGTLLGLGWIDPGSIPGSSTIFFMVLGVYLKAEPARGYLDVWAGD